MSPTDMAMTPPDALIAVMIAMSASDQEIGTTELVTIQRIVNHLPIFQGYDQDRLQRVTAVVFDLLEVDDGIAAFLGLVREVLPEKLSETAYALACDVAAADGRLDQSELRLLQELRHELDIDRLHAAAIERGARARHMVA